MIRARIAGMGSYLPKNVLTNVELSKTVDTSDEWITQRTGIRQRHLMGENETVSDMAVVAAQRALANAGLNTDDVDGIVCATSTPDNIFPSTAVRIQGKLGIKKAFSYDVQAACAGFGNALNAADNHIRLGQAKTILVVGADALTRLLNWEDRITCVLFGDGAGVFVLQASEGRGDISDHGILDLHIGSNGDLYDALYVHDKSFLEAPETIYMNGREIYKHAVSTMCEEAAKLLKRNEITKDDVDWLIPHQANSRIITAVAERLGLPMEKVVLTVANHANTSAASVPLAFDTARQQGKLRDGDLIVMETFGGGLTWGSSLIRL